MTKKSTKEINKVCEEIVLKQEIIKMRDGALQELEQAKAQLVFWDTRIKQVTGSVATYNLMLQKSQTPKSLILNDNADPKKEKK